MENYYLTKNVLDGRLRMLMCKPALSQAISVFGNLDSDGDIVLPGHSKRLYGRTGRTAQAHILHLYMHDPSKILSSPAF